MIQKVGIFSGSFDPVHVGHIEFALQAIEQFGLQQVVFLPEATPREKSPASISHRVNMLHLAITQHAKLLMSELEEQQFDVAKTLPKLQKTYHGSNLVFLCGSDLVSTFVYRWPGLDTFLRIVQLVVAIRAQDTAEAVKKILHETYAAYGVVPSYQLLDSPKKHLASTTVRAGSHKITDISPQVAAYIKKNSLY